MQCPRKVYNNNQTISGKSREVQPGGPHPERRGPGLLIKELPTGKIVLFGLCQFGLPVGKLSAAGIETRSDQIDFFS
mgnify:CR=1 FL=1